MAKRKVAVRAKKKSLPVRATTTEKSVVPPRKGTVPLWFIQRLKNKYPEPKSDGLPHLRVLDETLKRYRLGDDWVERVGSSKTLDGRDCFVAEPYDSDHVRQQFESLSKSLGLEVVISDESLHNPGRTIRLAAVKPS